MKTKLTILAMSLSMAAFSQTTNPAPYCDVPVNMASTTCKGGIKNVSIGSMSNTSLLTGKYTYYDNISAPVLYRGMSYTLSMTFDTVATSCRPASSKYLVIMAYDNTGVGLGTSFLTTLDSIYNGDATNYDMPVTKSVTISVPLSAPIGIIRMRVIRYGLPSRTGMDIKCIGSGGSSTDYYLVGETEDYNIRILDPISMDINSPIQQSATIYPNPCTDKLNISVSGNVIIRNELGQTVYDNKKYDKELIDISDFANGVYFVSVNGTNYLIRKI